MDFAGMIHPLALKRFFEDVFEKKHLHLSGRAPDYYAGVLGVADLDRMFAGDLNPARINLVRDGLPVAAQEWAEFNDRIAGPFKATVSAKRLMALYHSGATIVVNGAHRICPGLADFCRVLERQLVAGIQANVYITPPNVPGFGLHCDGHDTFILQISGSKHWALKEPPDVLAVAAGPLAETAALPDITLSAGDFLYIPRGTPHQAFAMESPSIHVTLAIKPRFGFNLLETLAQAAATKDFFRRSPPMGLADPEAMARYEEQFAEALQQLLDENPPQRLLAAQQQAIADNQSVPADGIFASAIFLAGLSVTSTVARRPGLPVATASHDGGLELRFDRREYLLPAIVDPALFLAAAPFRVGDIKGLLTDAGRISLAGDLVKAGYLDVIAP